MASTSVESTVAERILEAMMDVLRDVSPAAVEAFALKNVDSSISKLEKELDVFLKKYNVVPEIPPNTPNGWKFHGRVPLRTYNEDDAAEQHARVAECAILAARKIKAEAVEYAIDIVENEEIKYNFMANKHRMAASGLDPAELLLFHGTPPTNLDAILSNNFDPSFIRRVSLGHGFYLSEFSSVSLGYGQNTVILCRVLPGRSQLQGHQLDPERFDSYQLPVSHPVDWNDPKVAEAEGAPRCQHVVKHRDQILPTCLIHKKTLMGEVFGCGFKQESSKYRLERVNWSDLSYFDEDDPKQMLARVALGLVLRNESYAHGQLSSHGQVVSSVVFVDNAEVKRAFHAMKRKLAEDGRHNQEVLLFRHITAWRPSFFGKNEFDCSLLMSKQFGPGFHLTNWLDLDSPCTSIVVVYRVLLGQAQTKDLLGSEMLQEEALQWDQEQFNSLRVDMRFKAFTYVVQNKDQVLPYCVAVINNTESRKRLIGKIITKLRLPLTSPVADACEDQTPEVTCAVCQRGNMDLMEWFGCRSSCGLCADFFRRICVGSVYFVQPEECQQQYRCTEVVSCCACRLRRCLEAGMTAASLASYSDLTEAHQAAVAKRLNEFRVRVAAALNPAANDEEIGSSASSLSEEET